MNAMNVVARVPSMRRQVARDDDVPLRYIVFSCEGKMPCLAVAPVIRVGSLLGLDLRVPTCPMSLNIAGRPAVVVAATARPEPAPWRRRESMRGGGYQR